MFLHIRRGAAIGSETQHKHRKGRPFSFQASSLCLNT